MLRMRVQKRWFRMHADVRVQGDTGSEGKMVHKMTVQEIGFRGMPVSLAASGSVRDAGTHLSSGKCGRAGTPNPTNALSLSVGLTFQVGRP